MSPQAHDDEPTTGEERSYALASFATSANSIRISSTIDRTENELGGCMPKSLNVQLGLAVAVAVSFPLERVAFTSNVTDFVTPCSVRSPVSWNVKSPDRASGSVNPVVFFGTSSDVLKRVTSSGSRRMLSVR